MLSGISDKRYKTILNYQKISLRGKATLLIIFVVLVSLSLATVINIFQTNNLIASEQKRAGEAIVQGLAQAAELPMIVQDNQELDRLLGGFLWNTQVQFLLIFNEKNEIVAKRILDETAFAAFSLNDTFAGSLVVSHPIYFRANELENEWTVPADSDISKDEVGKVLVALSSEAVRRAQFKQSLVSLFAACLAVGLGIFLIYQLIGRWAKKVEDLVTAADAMKNGDFSHQVSVDSGDEIGKLASAFEAMRIAVRERDSELRDLNDSLHDLVRERTEKLKRAMVEAQTANDAKSSFLANMSHEIRTPMNAIIGMVGLALNKKLSPKLREYLLTVRSSAESLLAIINDILDFSKIEAGKIRIENVGFHLPQLFDKLADLFSDQAAARNIELVIACEPGIPGALLGDPLRLEQVFINLLGNAIKFTEHGEIFVHATIDSETDDSIRILFSISDTGVGIREEQYKTLFDPFTQADGSTTREYGGTGLGLSICRRLVNLHGGEIWVDSKPGKGTTVFFTAEFSRQPEDREIQYLVPATIRGLRGLVIDDNATARCITTKMLESFHFEIDVVSSCEEANQLLQGDFSRYDFFLVDWRMPEVDGIECVRKFRQLEGADEIPIIMMTAFGGDREMVMAREVGVDYFLTKPVKQSLLFDTIMEIFNHPEAMHASLEEREENIRSLVSSDHLAGVRILLAEDNRINQNVARELLESVGIIVEVANNGEEAVHILQDRGDEFDGVLMDVQMPVMDGYEATKVIRANPVLNEIPVIAVTAHAMQGDRDKCLQAGMNDYVAKPITPELLFSVLTRWTRPEHMETMRRNGLSAITGSEGKHDYPDTLPGIHVESGVARMAGNLNSYVRMLQDLHSFGNEVVAKMPALIREDLQAAAREIHTLKGSAANLSAYQLQDISVKFELAIKEMINSQGETDIGLMSVQDEYLDSVATALVQLAESMKQLEEICENMIAGNTAQIVSEATTEELIEVLDELKKMVEEYDPVAEEYWLEKKALFSAEGIDEEMVRMENQLRNYNFERVSDFLRRIRRQIMKGENTA